MQMFKSVGEYCPFSGNIGHMSGLTLRNCVSRRENRDIPRDKSPGDHYALRRCFAEISRENCGMQAHNLVDETIQVLSVLQGREVRDGFKTV